MSTIPGVYHGFWTNWSGGAIAGATLTLSRQEGAYLVAFLALFVNLAGTNTWQILSYLVFRAKANPAKLDTSTQQHLIVLRNVASDCSALWELGKVSWRSRKDARKLRRRPTTLLLAAAFHTVAFTVAGIFASAVTNAKSEVLLRPTLCGGWSIPSIEDVTLGVRRAEIWENIVYRAAKSERVASQCYNASRPLRDSCNAPGRRLLDWDVTLLDECPFDKSMCINDTVVRLDTGYINTLHDLGINSRPSDALTFRKTLECAPLLTTGFSATYHSHNLTNDTVGLLYSLGQNLEGSEFTAFFYGPNFLDKTNATCLINNGTFDTSSGSVVVPYRTHAEVAGNSVTATFDPIPQMRRTDAQVILLLLENNALYPAPVTDPWFTARQPTDNIVKIAFPEEVTMFAAQPLVSALGCVDQTEVCNPAHNLCVPLMTSVSVNVSQVETQLQLNERQIGIFDRFQMAIRNSIELPSTTGEDGHMLASTMTDYWVSAPLPDNQWIIELENWFASLLVYIQLSTVSYISRFELPSNDRWKQSPSEVDKWMCNNQIVQRNDHASFSVLGLVTILSIGGLAMVTNLLLPTVLPRLRNRSDISKYRNQKWEDLELLELQRTSMDHPTEKQTAQVFNKADYLTPTMKSSIDGKARSRKGSSAQSVVSDLSTASTLEQPSRNVSVTTVDLRLQQDDFPPQELARLISGGS